MDSERINYWLFYYVGFWPFMTGIQCVCAVIMGICILILLQNLPEELQNEMDRFDLSAVSSLKQQVEMMIENKKNGV